MTPSAAISQLQVQPRMNKYDFLMGRECLLKLHLFRFRPELIDEAKKPSPALLEEGRKVGELARGLFPNGLLLETRDFEEAKRQTAEAIEKGAQILFEAAFEFQGLRIRTDILVGVDDGWQLWEVKATTKADDYVEDVAYQIHLLRALGMKVCPGLVSINKEYEHDGSPSVDLRGFFQFSDSAFAAKVEALLPEIGTALPTVRAALQDGAFPTGTRTKGCKDCLFHAHCFPPSAKHSVLDLYYGGDKVTDLLGRGIEWIEDIPRQELAGEKRAEIKLRQWDANQIGLPVWAPAAQINIPDAEPKPALEVLYGRPLDDPVFYLDFEASSPAIPTFACQRPYARIPFQWSCHIRRTPDGPLEHEEWLNSTNQDPRREFCETLIHLLGQQGSIIVYSSYEQSTLNMMAAMFPDLAPSLISITGRMVDLCAAVRDRFYHPAFNGSFSIKMVLPALVPDMSYKGLPVSNGMEAVAAYEKMVQLADGAPEKARLIRDMLDYCGQDTLAMVRVEEAILVAARLGRIP